MLFRSKAAARTGVKQATTLQKPGKKVAGRAPARAGARSTIRAAPTRRRQLVIDATNVICGAQNTSRLDLLLSLVVAAAKKGRDVLCIFDASTPHRLETSPERDLYRWLLQDKEDHFIQCPGRTQADALILAEAERMRCQVVSNDFFRDREERFPWVRDKDRVLRHQPIRDVLYVDDVAVPIETDLRALKRQIDRLIA